MSSEHDDVSLMFALPDVSNDGGDAVRRLEEKLKVETFNKILKKMKPRKIDLKIPRFNHRSGTFTLSNKHLGTQHLYKDKNEQINYKKKSFKT